MKKTAYDMIYLTGCAINDVVPKQTIVQKADLEKLLKISKRQCLSSAVCTSLLSAGVELPKEWIECSAKAIRKIILLDDQRRKIIFFMEKNGIWYMPLKGVILKNLYPSIGIREMADNDILFDKRYADVLKKYMLTQGYSVKSGKNCVHYSFTKPPVYNFEMHVSLFGENFYGDKNFNKYYNNVKKRLVKDRGNNYGFHFNDEDFYIYITVHGAKHYFNAGTGLRTLADCYVYLKKKPNLNFNYIRRELEKLGISDYEAMTRRVALKIFSNPSPCPNLTEKERIFLESHLFVGAYGTIQNNIKMKSEKIAAKNKFDYIFKRLFPDIEFYRIYYPLAYKHRILLPFAWIYRLFRSLIFNRKKIINELRTISKFL